MRSRVEDPKTFMDTKNRRTRRCRGKNITTIMDIKVEWMDIVETNIFMDTTELRL